MENNFAIKTERIQNQDNIDIEDLAADITITFYEKNLTDNYDTIDGLRKTSVALAPYPLAWWIVSNWWRLRWEPTPLVPSTDWRMSHFLPAIGDGYCWPSIGFQTDGEIIRITSLPTTGEDGASVIYHTLFSELISAKSFKKSIESFIDECNNKYFDSNISLLWNFIQDERKDKEATIFRIIEAKLGFNIDKGPEEEINKIIEKAKYFGEKSTQELSVLLYKESIVEKEIDGLKNHNIGTDIFIENLYEMRKYKK